MCTTTVLASGVSTEATSASMYDGPWLSAVRRAKLAATAAESSGVPSWNVIPCAA